MHDRIFHGRTDDLIKSKSFLRGINKTVKYTAMSKGDENATQQHGARQLRNSCDY